MRARQPAVGADQARADGREPPAEIAGVELAAKLLQPPLARSRAVPRTARASACDSSAAWRPRIATRARKAGERRPAAQHVDAAARVAGRGRRAAARSRSRSRSMRAAELVLGRDDDLGGRRRRRRPQIGDEIGDRDVGFVADRRDDRHRRQRDRARDDLLVERPEILDRAAAAADDDDVDAGHAADRPQRRARSRAPRPRPARAPAESRSARSRAGGASTLMMSRIAAPSSDVTMPILRGSAGSGRLRAASNSPSSCSRFFS